MAIIFFIYSLLFISVISLFTTVNNDISESDEKDIALVTFNESTMYTLNDKQVTRIVQSSKAIRYKEREEMFKGTFVHRVKSNDKNSLADVVSADFIEKRGQKIKFMDHVKYSRDNFITFKTEVLNYDLDKKIAYNDKPFTAKYYGDFLKGTNIYLDIEKSYFKSKKAHFEIEMEKKE